MTGIDTLFLTVRCLTKKKKKCMRDRPANDTTIDEGEMESYECDMHDECLV